MTPSSDCSTTLEQFARRDFSDWHGLRPACSLTDLEARFPRDDQWVGRGRLGEREYEFIWLPVPGYENPVRAWLEGERAVLLEVESPEITDALGLLQQLGEPDRRLEAYRYTVQVPEGEWVYASRGLTLFVYPPDTFIYHLAVYEPTSVERYVSHLRPNLKVTRMAPE